MTPRDSRGRFAAMNTPSLKWPWGSALRGSLGPEIVAIVIFFIFCWAGYGVILALWTILRFACLGIMHLATMRDVRAEKRNAELLSDALAWRVWAEENSLIVSSRLWADIIAAREAEWDD